MPNVDIQIELVGGEPGAALPRFPPGSRLEGQVQVTPAEDLHCRRVVAQVTWRAEEPHYADYRRTVVGDLEISRGPLAAGTLVSRPFVLDLPKEPWSYTGELFSIVWEVRVVVDLPGQPDVVVTKPFRMDPRR